MRAARNDLDRWVPEQNALRMRFLLIWIQISIFIRGVSIRATIDRHRQWIPVGQPALEHRADLIGKTVISRRDFGESRGSCLSEQGRFESPSVQIQREPEDLLVRGLLRDQRTEGCSGGLLVPTRM